MRTLLIVLILQAQAANLIRLTAVDGHQVELNVEAIVVLRPPREQTQRTTHEATGCIIFTSDAKFTAVKETCEEVKTMIKRPDR